MPKFTERTALKEIVKFAKFYYIPPFTNEWLFVYIAQDAFNANITLTDKILKI